MLTVGGGESFGEQSVNGLLQVPIFHEVLRDLVEQPLGVKIAVVVTVPARSEGVINGHYR